MTRRDLAYYAVRGLIGTVAVIAAVYVVGAAAIALGIEPGIVEHP